jgi:hypothetical protein
LAFRVDALGGHGTEGCLECSDVSVDVMQRGDTLHHGPVVMRS